MLASVGDVNVIEDVLYGYILCFFSFNVPVDDILCFIEH